ncbi:MAG: L-lactate permease [candidate division KSB1 bacterium]|nr:L-lactate permease [candidate division KSB1 bacterium]MDZ7319239.1 L-lactate permease [candidate division KSB1 bacterium]MDZ7340595.1 L-lactate permease [candidate division KSB1 bacterium]
MTGWTQHYTPVLDHLILSALVAALPVIVLLGMLAWLHAKAYVAALVGLISSLIIAILIYGMPAHLAAMAAANGAAFGLFPIGWIVLCAIFIYDITLKTGQFEIVKESIASLASDRRLQTLLIAFSFGAFIEGAAGFGTPVAISAAMLIGLGFKPLPAAGLALLGNTAPVAYGALGTPIIALSAVTGLPIESLSAAVGRQLPFFSLIVPFWLIWAMAGFKKMLEVWPACLASGLSFAMVQFLVSNFHGPWIVDIAGAIASMVTMIILLRFWQPRTIWRFNHENPTLPDIQSSGDNPVPRISAQVPVRFSRRETLVAWMPWLFLSIFVFIWGLPQVKGFLNSFHGITIFKWNVPYLHQAVFRTAPVVSQPKAEDAIFTFNWLSATGTGLLISGILSGICLGLRPLSLLRIFWGTLKRVRLSLLTIAAMLALSYATRYGGLDATMGLAFASTGVLFPFFSALLGWLGVALTGSDTSSNVLFGNLQQITAQQLGISPILATSANSSGGVMGKMIDAQSIVVAGVATGQQGEEGTILRYVFWHSLALAILVGLLILSQAYVFPGVVPQVLK